MKTLFFLFAIAAVLRCGQVHSQVTFYEECECENVIAGFGLCDKLDCCAQEMAETLKGELPHLIDSGRYDKLVTNSTFNRLLADDMAKVLTLDNAINRATRYAAVSIDEDKSTFTFAPFVARLHSDLFHPQDPAQPYLPTWGFVNSFIKGKINNDGFAEIFNGGKVNREITIGGTLAIFLGKNYYREDNESCCGFRSSNYREAQRALPSAICQKYQKIMHAVANGDVLTYADNADILCECDDIKAAMRKDFSDVEEKLAKPFWSGKTRLWLSISPEYGGKTITLLDTLKAGATPESQTFGTGSLRAAANLLYEAERASGTWSSYFAFSIAAKRSNQFSDMSTLTWNKYVTRPDTSEIITDNKDVFLYKGGTVNHQITPSATIQFVELWNGDRFGLGLDLSFTYDQLYKADGAEANHKLTESYGIIFPFRDKAGDRTINLSLFYQRSHFKLASMDDEFLVGVKFAVPIFSLD